MNDKYLTITALNKYLKYRFDTDPNLQKVYLKGEISNFKPHTTGHFYFSLKDEHSKINAIMFASSAKKVPFIPQDGMKVLVTGRVSIYEATGGYQIYVDEMLEDGIGSLYIAFEQLKEKLSKEGLFNEEHKKKIPKIPERVGIVTASTGAAIRDILSTIKRRYPLCETLLFPCLVQGNGAKEDIVKKIKMAENYNLDVLIIGRGGGSIEDLWAFNEEVVARAIYECSIPTISAVGHEIDFTIADFVADMRAPTPTGAAELAVPNLSDLCKHLTQLQIRINEAMNKELKIKKIKLVNIKNSYIIKNPMIMIDNKKQRLDIIITNLRLNLINRLDLAKTKLTNVKNAYVIKNPYLMIDAKKEKMNVSKITLTTLIYSYLDKEKYRLNNIREKHIITNPHKIYLEKKQHFIKNLEKLTLLNPLNILERGFTLPMKDKRTIKLNDLNKNDIITLKFFNGNALVEIKEIMEEENGEKK